MGSILISEIEAARRIGIARITLLRARLRGEIAYHRVGRLVKYSEQQITVYLKATERQARRGAA